MFHIEYPRERWEEPGYTVAEHTGSPPPNWSRITKVVLHYPGHAAFRYPITSTQVIEKVRSTQRYYADQRGYSIGYQWLVTVNGDIIQGRGFDYANAANSPENGNSISIQLHCEGVGDDANPATPAQITAVNQIVTEACRRAGRTLMVVPHSATKPTSCPGDAIRNQIQAGAFRPDDSIGDIVAIDLTVSNPPTRIYNSRDGDGPTAAAGEIRSLVVPNAAEAVAVEVTLTAASPASNGYLSAWGQGSRPQASCLNYTQGVNIANTTTVPLDGNTFHIYARSSTDIIVDLVGIWR